ncbi:MAG: hypothetical protein H7Z41_14535, partial [Cytophagales bacterium]|nr:hypothetical protein [Armatimonadota bacterium]
MTDEIIARVSDTEGASTQASRAYAILTSLLRRLPPIGASRGVAGEATKRAICHLALRAALHPALLPYRDDPLLPLEGEFVSTDAHLDALLSYLAASEDSGAILAGLSAADRCYLPPSDPASDQDPPNDLVGAVWGSLYLPGRGRAIPCRIWAVYNPALPDPDRRWRAPQTVRDASPAVTASAAAAFAAAHTLIGHHSGALISAPLVPAPLYFDLCCLEEDDAAAAAVQGSDRAPTPPGDALLAAVAGESLALPLALAFLSALLDLPVRSELGATGALSSAGPDTSGRLVPVEWVFEKAGAHLRRFPRGRFLYPADGREEKDGIAWQTVAPGSRTPVETLAQAARESLHRLAGPLPATTPPPSRLPISDDLRFPEPRRETNTVSPPVGAQIAFLRVEVENAVRLWETHPARMHHAAAEYEALFQAAVRSTGGYRCAAPGGGSGMGGGMAAFGSAGTACQAAITL